VCSPGDESEFSVRCIQLAAASWFGLSWIRRGGSGKWRVSTRHFSSVFLAIRKYPVSHTLRH
ncbi:MAG: hypothetical protein VX709_13780, partial [Pseudomonadota bacterium]|nr:hypothetical protein [Pseudomonadota bacterium]